MVDLARLILPQYWWFVNHFLTPQVSKYQLARSNQLAARVLGVVHRVYYWQHANNAAGWPDTLRVETAIGLPSLTSSQLKSELAHVAPPETARGVL
jgi:hypothetical protein